MIFISILCALFNSTSYYVFVYLFFWFCSRSLPSRTNIYSNYSPLFLLLPSRRRKGGEVSRVVGALLLPSFSPSLFLSPIPLSTSKRRGGSARGRRASPPLLFSVSFFLLIVFPASFFTLLQASVNSAYHRSQLRTS